MTTARYNLIQFVKKSKWITYHENRAHFNATTI